MNPVWDGKKLPKKRENSAKSGKACMSADDSKDMEWKQYININKSNKAVMLQDNRKQASTDNERSQGR